MAVEFVTPTALVFFVIIKVWAGHPLGADEAVWAERLGAAWASALETVIMVYRADLGLVLGKPEGVSKAHTGQNGTASVPSVRRLGNQQVGHGLEAVGGGPGLEGGSASRLPGGRCRSPPVGRPCLPRQAALAPAGQVRAVGGRYGGRMGERVWAGAGC